MKTSSNHDELTTSLIINANIKFCFNVLEQLYINRYKNKKKFIADKRKLSVDLRKKFYSCKDMGENFFLQDFIILLLLIVLTQKFENIL